MSKIGTITVRVYSREAGSDLPEDVVVEWIRGASRKYQWRCLKCGIRQQTVNRAGAFAYAWDHVTGDNPCEELKR